MEKADDFVAFTASSKPLVARSDDQPKLTNSVQCAARKRKKQEVEASCSGPSTTPAATLQETKENGELVKLECKTNKHIKLSEDNEPLIASDNDASSVRNEASKESGGAVIGNNIDDESAEDNGEANGEKVETSGLSKEPKEDWPPNKRRFVLFVWNISYETKEADIMEHFKNVGSITSVRIAKHKDPNTGRGFCHLEVGDEEAYLKALCLHNTFMAKCRINVEYSSGQSDVKRKNVTRQTLKKSRRSHQTLNAACMEGGSLEESREGNAAITSSPPANIHSLPPEMMLHIFSYLNVTDLCRTVPKVCTLWKQLYQDPSLYRVITISEQDSVITVDDCMKLATSLQSLTLIIGDMHAMFRKLSRKSVDNNIGKLSSLSLKPTSNWGYYSPYSETITLRLERNISLFLLKKCSNLKMLHLQSFLNFPSSFFNDLNHRCLRIVHLVNMRPLLNQSEKSFVTRCLQLEKISVYSSSCWEREQHSIVFTANELVELCVHLCGTLRVLHLNYGDWSAGDLNCLGICHCLQDLFFYNVKTLSDEGLLVIGSLTGLRKLGIKYCVRPPSSEGTWIRMITSPTFKSLESLVMLNCSISNETALAIGEHLTNLKKLSFHSIRPKGNFLPQILPTGFKSIIKGCPNLEELSLNYVHPESLSAILLIPIFLPRLQKLSIAPKQHFKHHWSTLLLERMPRLRFKLA